MSGARMRGATPPVMGGRMPPRNSSKESVLRSSPRISPRIPPAPKSARTSLSSTQRSSSCAAASKSPVVKNAPIRPEEAKASYGALLTSYEQTEIQNYPEIYFVGCFSKKVQPASSSAQNYGFDTPDHHYRANVGDHIAYRYEIRSVLGSGAFGQVLRCFDHKTKGNVALKIIVNTKETEQQAKAETSILQMLNKDDPTGSSNIVRFMSSFVFRKHVCATFEVLGQNLFEFGKSNMFRPYPMRHVKLIAQQLLTTLAFVHKHGIVHCDMKPENVLLVPGTNTTVRVIDFGSACKIGQKHFTYIQSRFYRAPEVMFGMEYGPPIDIWSVGCIIGEMICGRPIFCGDTEVHQVEHYISALGAPPADMVNKALRRKVFFDDSGKLRVSSKQKRLPPTQLSQLIRCNDADALDLLSKCLTWTPSKRITAQDALKHPFFTAQTGEPEFKGSAARKKF